MTARLMSCRPSVYFHPMKAGNIFLVNESLAPAPRISTVCVEE